MSAVLMVEMMICLTVFGACCNFLHAYLSLTVISRTVANIRREAFHRVVHLPLKSVLGSGSSDLVSRIVYDTGRACQDLQRLPGHRQQEEIGKNTKCGWGDTVSV